MNVLVYNVAASESGALAILNDFYDYIKNSKDKNTNWYFVISTPILKETENITIIRHPEVKKSWLHRLKFENITIQKIIKKHSIDAVFSMQNIVIPRVQQKQVMYLHQPLPFVEHKFKINQDFMFWVYQNIISKLIMKSIKKANHVIVQTKWMKAAVIDQTKIPESNISVIAPNINLNDTSHYVDSLDNRKDFFYPATALSYKNHKTILEACKVLEKEGFTNYNVNFTIEKDTNKLSKEIYNEVKTNNLNIILLGNLSRDKVFELYSKSTLIFPSFIETFGLPLLEARNIGGFVLASNCPFSNEILDGYSNAMFFDYYDSVTLANQMKEIINGKQHIDEDRVIYAEKNTWDNVKKIILSII